MSSQIDLENVTIRVSRVRVPGGSKNISYQNNLEKMFAVKF